MFGKLLNILVNSDIKTRYALVLRPILSKSIRCSNPLAFLKVQSCKLYNNKYMIVSTQITNTKIFSFIPVLVFKLLSRKVLFTNRKDKRNCKK